MQAEIEPKKKRLSGSCAIITDSSSALNCCSGSKMLCERKKTTLIPNNSEQRLPQPNMTNQVLELSDSETEIENELRTNGILTMPPDDDSFLAIRDGTSTKQTLDDSDLPLFEIPIESTPRKHNPNVAVIKPMYSNSEIQAVPIVLPPTKVDDGLKKHDRDSKPTKSNNSSRSSSPDIVMFKGKGKQPADPRKRTIVKRSQPVEIEIVQNDATTSKKMVQINQANEDKKSGNKTSISAIHFGSSVAMKREANNRMQVIDLTDTPMVIDLESPTYAEKPLRSPKIQARVAPFKTGIDEDVIFVSESTRSGPSTTEDTQTQEDRDLEYARRLQQAFDNMDALPLDHTRDSPNSDLDYGAGSSRIEMGPLSVNSLIRTGIFEQLSSSFQDDVPTGYPKHVIDSLPVHKVKDVSELDEQDCMICMDQYKRLELITTIPTCQHKFHKKCVAKWLKLKKTCPVCRCEAI